MNRARFSRLPAVACAWALAVAIAAGGGLVHEPFGYGAGGSLAGADGGAGVWIGAWAASGGKTPFGVGAPGLARAGVYSATNKVADALGSSDVAGARQWNSSSVGTNGSELWFSCLFEFDGTNSNANVVPLAGSASPSTAEYFGVLLDARPNQSATLTNASPHGDVRGQMPGSSQGSPTGFGNELAAAPGVNLLVVRFRFVDAAGGDTLTVWLNPDPAAGTPPDGSGAGIAGDLPAPGAARWLWMRGGTEFKGSLDEIRMGRTFAEVASASAPDIEELPGPGPGPEGVTRYLDSMDGDDGNDGLTEAAAWRSLERAGAHEFGPGDALLLRRGGYWRGSLAPRGGGTNGFPVTVGAYGAGPAPVLDGGGLSGMSRAVIRLHNQSHWTFRDLEITNADPGGTEPAVGNLSHNIVRATFDADPGARVGVRVTPDGAENVHVDALEFYHPVYERERVRLEAEDGALENMEVVALPGGGQGVRLVNPALPGTVTVTNPAGAAFSTDPRFTVWFHDEEDGASRVDGLVEGASVGSFLANGTALRHGILVTAGIGAPGVVGGLRFENLVFRDVGGVYHSDLSRNSAAIRIVASDFEAGSPVRFDGVAIDGCHFERVHGCAVTTMSRAALEGVGSANWTSTRFTGLVVRNCTAREMSSNAFVPMGADETGLFERNLCGPVGVNDTGNTFFSWRCRGTVFQFNEVFDHRGGNAQGDPPVHEGCMYDADGGSPGTVWQYSYSHDNANGLMDFISTDSAPVICRHNISQNDKGMIFQMSQNTPARIYNNTLFLGAHRNPAILKERRTADRYEFKNNLIVNESGAAGFASVNGALQGAFSHNAYSGLAVSNLPPDANAFTGGSGLLAPGSGGEGLGTLDGYKLRSDSPLLASSNAGALIPGNGGRDLWGYPVPGDAGPVRGACAAPGLAADTLQADDFANADPLVFFELAEGGFAVTNSGGSGVVSTGSGANRMARGLFSHSNMLLSAELRVPEPAEGGLMAREDASGAHYRMMAAALDGERLAVRLERVNEAGAATVLASNAVAWTAGGTFQMDFALEGASLVGRVNGTKVVAATDGVIGSGRCGLFARGAGVFFGGLVVSRFDGDFHTWLLDQGLPGTAVPGDPSMAGLPLAFHYAGGLPLASGARFAGMGGGGNGGAGLHFRFPLAAGLRDVSVRVFASTDLAGWREVASWESVSGVWEGLLAGNVSVVPLGDGVSEIRIGWPEAEDGRLFWRLGVAIP